MVDLVALACTFAGGFYCGSKFKTFAALKESVKGWFK